MSFFIESKKGLSHKEGWPLRHNNWDGGFIVFRGNWSYTAYISCKIVCYVNISVES